MKASGIGGASFAFGLLTTVPADARNPFPGQDEELGGIIDILNDVGLIVGLGFIIGAIIKFKIHKRNPGGGLNAVDRGLVRLWWDSLDGAVADSLAGAGYDLDWLTDAVADFKKGETDDVVEILEFLQGEETA